ncbi:hypothetical protein ACFVT1_39450 [Streptomyces sp. NPDC057963]|uniref:hypothetical protein n=1 Tax=Streptomyces sp. NPDC057963 TaxID=3346290 RepID=UPI0036E0A66B
MTNNLDTLLTALYVKIDDELETDRWTGRPPQLTDAELVTLAVAQALLGFGSETRWPRYANVHLASMFPITEDIGLDRLSASTRPASSMPGPTTDPGTRTGIGHQLIPATALPSPWSGPGATSHKSTSRPQVRAGPMSPGTYPSPGSTSGH